MINFSNAVRWTARGLSALILIFWGFLAVAHLTGTEGSGSRALLWQDYFILTTLVVALVGLLLSWKFELAGSVLTLVAVASCATINWKVLIFPGTIIPLAAFLFLVSGISRRNKPQAKLETG